MSFPEPVAGLVIHYTFLWSNEKAQGAYEGSKERPCAMIVAIKQDNGGIRAVVVPITHTPPSNVDDSIEVPASICKSLGLDRQKQWIRFRS